MANGTPAEFSIGGRIPTSLVQLLCQTITEAYLALDWGDAHFQPKGADDLRQACSERDGSVVLWMCDDQARGGQFEGLEQFLRDNRVAFRRRSDGTSEFGPEIVEFRPDTGLVSISIDAAGEPVVGVAPMRRIAALLARALELLKQDHRRGLAAVRACAPTAAKTLAAAIPTVGTVRD